jgi:hypothetical protein
VAIQFKCSACEQVMKAPEAAAGRKGRCKGCGHVERVPRPLVFKEGEYRPHHYVFAHVMAPAICFGSKEGSGMLMAMCTDDSGKFLRKTWRMASEGLPRSQHLKPEGLEAKMVEVDGDHALAMVRLPTAHYQAEAIYLVGSYQFSSRGSMFRLLTLELSYDFSKKTPCTMLCEWSPTRDGGCNHGNFGPGPPDSETALTKAIVDLLAQG